MSESPGKVSGQSQRHEARVSRRAGHIAVAHRERGLVWGGYEESQVDTDQYLPSSELMIYNSLTQTWTAKKTTGEVPTKCSGAGAAVLGDVMYVVAGFHKIMITMNALREVNGWMSDSDEEPEGDTVETVEISNSIWSLDLETYVWTKLSPDGVPPLRCDKTAVWTHKDKVYIFGGFGPPPTKEQRLEMGKLFEFCDDPQSSQSIYNRGWSNQLVCYNTSTDTWEWPVTSGPAPSPRAAHSVARVGDTAYVFGGRHLDTRLNDLYSLNLITMRWNLLVSNNCADNTPVGRSWQTMTPIQTGKEEGGLVIYGGFDNALTALGDCWRMDLQHQPSTWVRCPHLELGPRLWHASLELDSSQVMVAGGLTNNILAPNYVSKHHAEKVLFLKVAPSSLLKLCLEFITKNKDLFNKEVEELPMSLKKIVKIRVSSGA